MLIIISLQESNIGMILHQEVYINDFTSIYTFFETEVMYLQIILFKALMNLSATTDFPSLCVEHISMSFFSSHDFIDLL